MCSPPFEALEEGVHDLLRLLERFCPGAQQLVARRSQLVHALRGARLVGVPLRADEPVLLERAQHPVEAAELRPLAGNELRRAVDELVAVRRLFGEEQEERRLEEAFHASADVPVTGGITPASAGAMSMCETHIDAERL